MNNIVPNNFDKFMKGKSEYIHKELLKKVPKEYHSVINVFIKCNADTFLEHREKDHTIKLEKGKISSFVQNYRPLLDQENNTIIKYIQEHLGKSFICSSSSAAAAPVLLMKAEDYVSALIIVP